MCKRFSSKGMLFVLTTLLAVPLPAFAIGVGSIAGAAGGIGGPPSSIGAGVSGMSNSHPGGVLASKREVAQDSAWVAGSVGSQITRMGKSLRSGQAQNTAVTINSLSEQLQNLHTQIKNLSSTQDALYRNHTYKNPGAIAPGACSSPQFGAGARDGNAGERAVGDRLNGNSMKYYKNQSSQVGEMQNLDGVPDPSPKGGLFPSGGTLTAKGVRGSAKTVNAMTNPAPAMTLPKNAKKTSAGKKYNDFRKLKRADLAVPSSSLNALVAVHSPTVDEPQWAKTIWASMGESGNPEGMTKKGMMSPMALLHLSVQSRYANPKWYTELQTKNQDGLLRELLSMEAARMEMQYRQLQWDQRIGAMLAQTTADKVNKEYNGTLSNLRQQAENQGVGAN